jgi:tetratricopeptide (TPR) repeat protein
MGGRESLMNLTMNGQSQLEKGDFAAAQRSLDAVIKANPTFYPAYYIRAEVFLDQRKYQEAIQDCNEALRKDSTFAEGLCAPSGAALRFHANGNGQNVRVAHRPQACVPCRLDYRAQIWIVSQVAIQKSKAMKVTKNIGMLLLAVYLIIDGLLGFGINFGPAIFLLYLVALAAGIFILIGK